MSWGADAKVRNVVVDGNAERKDMAKMMDELDLKDDVGGGVGGGGGGAGARPFGDEEDDDLLALMDDACK